MKKYVDNVARIKDQIKKLDTIYSVWLISLPSIFNPGRIGFMKRLRELTGHEVSNDIKKSVRNGRARIAGDLSYEDAEKLRSQIANIGGEVIVQQDMDDSAIAAQRRALENDLRNAEAALEAENQRVEKAVNEAKLMPDYSGLLSEDILEAVRNFAEEHEVKYFITKEGLVDIFGDVEINPDDLDENYYLPFAFGRVYGDFDCNESGLVSLEGCPKHVDGDFDCGWNCLDSYYGSPRYVGGDFICLENEDYVAFNYNEKELPDYIGGKCTIDYFEENED